MLKNKKTETGGSDLQSAQPGALDSLIRSFFHFMPYEKNGHARLEKIIGQLQDNKFRFLLETPSNASQLKENIRNELEGRFHDYDRKLVERAFEYVDDFYAGVLRKDGKTEASAHIYAVAYGTLVLGCDFEIFVAALFHDLKEDTKQKWAKKTMKEVTDELRGIAGEIIVRNVDILTHDKKNESYREYLERIYQSGNLQLMVVKAVDMVHNLTTLYFKGCPEKMRDSVVRKALYHVEIWRKLNHQLFELMFTVIKDNAPPEQKTGVAAEILGLVNKLDRKSMRQTEREERKLVFVNHRDYLDLSLISDLPDSGSPVITVYLPRHLQPEDELEVEFPHFSGSASYVYKKLKQVLPWMKFEQVPSKLPRELVCTTIFKAKLPTEDKEAEFRAKLRELATEEGRIKYMTGEFLGKP